MVGKQLSALLQILRSNGVTSYETPQLKLTLGPAARPKTQTSTAIDLSPEALAEAAGEEAPEDWRFALEQPSSVERLTAKHFPRRPADPRRNPKTDHSKVHQ